MSDRPAPSDFFLDHAPSSDWLGELEGATHTASCRNPTCGDEVGLQLQVEQSTIQAAAFRHQGCTVSRAAASILCEHLQQQPVGNLPNLTPEKMLELLRIPISPARRRCALLAWEALQSILGDSATATPETDTQP